MICLKKNKGMVTFEVLVFMPIFLFIQWQFILPMLDQYKPDMLLLSIGFDPHWRDPLGHLSPHLSPSPSLILHALFYPHYACNSLPLFFFFCTVQVSTKRALRHTTHYSAYFRLPLSSLHCYWPRQSVALSCACARRRL